MDYNITYRQRYGGWQYIISYKYNGKWKQKAKQGFKTKKDAKAYALDFIKKNEELLTDDFLDSMSKDMTLKELLDDYILSEKFYQTASSISNMKCSINSFKPLFNHKVMNITESELQDCVNMLLERNLKYTSIKSKVGYCRMLFNYAMKKFYFFKHNPAANLRFDRDKNLVSQRRSLEPTEEKELLEALSSKERYKKYHLAVLLCLKAGLRIGEVGGLQFKDIDFNKRKMSISKQWKMLVYAKDGNPCEFGIGPLKSKNSNRTIPIPNDLFEILYNLNEISRPNDFIIEFGNKRNFQTMLNRELKLLGFNVCIHELRHTYGTKLISNGIDLKTVAYLMGHDLKMTIEVYSHVTNDMLLKAQNIIEKNF